MINTDADDRERITAIAVHADRASLEVLYHRYHPRVMGFLLRLTSDQQLMDEIYNDLMWTVWRKSAQYRGQSKVSSWIFSIAYRDCLRLLRKQRVRNLFTDHIGQDPLFNAAIAEDIQPTIETDDIMQKALSSLPAKQRLAIELCYQQGHSVEEIGEIVGCPSNTVKTRLHHARKKLRSYIEVHANPA